MSKQPTMTERIKALKTGKSFTVKTEYERQSALRSAKFLLGEKIISFMVVTRKTDEGFKVVAI